jgi:two-component system cell cycle response regulator DivK
MSATILIIENNVSIRKALQSWLEVILLHQYQVLEAAYMEEALAVAQANLPQMVLMDLGFPTMKDLEAITGFKAAVPASQIVVLSDYEVDNETYQALVAAHGASGYLPKKSLLKELRPMLTELLFLPETSTADKL